MEAGNAAPRRYRGADAATRAFREAWGTYVARDGRAGACWSASALGTMAFGMQDVLLEPYGGQVLGMAVGDTTLLTATLAAGGLLGFSLASAILSRGFDPARMSTAGAWVGVPAFAAVILAASVQSVPLFFCGALLIGFGAGVFSHGTLTITMNRAPKDQVGLALGAWGAAQATAAGVAMALGGVLRDLFAAAAASGAFGTTLNAPATGYAFVYAIELLLLFATIVVMGALVRERRVVQGDPRLSLGGGE
ncbi:MAG: MFS transporter [Burkholderiaceae bacterium]|nr:MFS transporter [Burkholderiaceae bacterium]